MAVAALTVEATYDVVGYRLVWVNLVVGILAVVALAVASVGERVWHAAVRTGSCARATLLSRQWWGARRWKG